MYMYILSTTEESSQTVPSSFTNVLDNEISTVPLANGNGAYVQTCICIATVLMDWLTRAVSGEVHIET